MTKREPPIRGPVRSQYFTSADKGRHGRWVIMSHPDAIVCLLPSFTGTNEQARFIADAINEKLEREKQ